MRQIATESIPISSISVNKRNTRHARPEDPSIKELAQNIKATDGVLQPIVVRQTGENGDYELLAGERRLVASKTAGFSDIRATVYEASDVEALEVLITENLQRLDLTPFQEAEQLKALFETGKDPKEAAAVLGKSDIWVARRAKLCELHPKLKSAAQNPQSEFSVWSVGMWEIIARLPESEQLRIFQESEYGASEVNLRDLVRELESLSGKLSTFPWKLDDATYKAGACNTCTKQTGVQPELFTDVFPDAVKKSRCLDAVCLASKAKEFIERRTVELKKEYKNLAYIGEWGGVDTGIKPTLQGHQYSIAKKSDGGVTPALYVKGPKVGELVWIKKRSFYSENSESSRTDTEKPKVDKALELKQRRAKHVLLHLVARFCEQKDNSKLSLETLLAGLVAFQLDYDRDDRWKSYKYTWASFDKVLKSKTELRASIWESFHMALSASLNFSSMAEAEKLGPHVERFCKLLDWDLPAIRIEAEKAFPTPKSLLRKEKLANVTTKVSKPKEAKPVRRVRRKTVLKG